MQDPRSRYVRKLHGAYKRGKLHVFIGAGISLVSGFPGWESLNKSLLQGYLAATIGNSTPAAMVASPNIQTTADAIYDVLGRDAVADFVHNASPRQFVPLLASALYQGRSVEDLPLASIHYQIAAFSGQAHLSTLNLDPLLELALTRRFPKKLWQEFRSPDLDGKARRRQHLVEHLHGWLDPDGTRSDRLVLTESQYIELTGDPKAPANQSLRRMLSGENVTLVLGMSLADPNFRRVLYFLNKRGLSSRERVYVVTVRQQPVIDHYVEMHWARRGLRLLFLQSYEEVPGLLRDIQWGEPKSGELPRWIGAATDWRRSRLPDPLIFTKAWQNIAHGSLSALCEQIKKMFAVQAEEDINAALFIPFSGGKRSSNLRMAAFSETKATPRIARMRAQNRSFQLKRGREQGIGGVSYASGTIRAVAFGEGEVDINFTPRMISGWVSRKGYRDWRSILSVPVIDTPYWLPVAVITLTSNMAEPFWKRFGRKADLLELELYAIIRRTGAFCLRDFTAGTK